MSTEVKLALSNLRHIQYTLEREVEWVLSDDEDIWQQDIKKKLFAINITIGDLIEYLEDEED